MKYIFILNPTAAAGNTKKLSSKIVSYCKFNEIDYDLIETEYIGHASEIARKYTLEDNVTIFSIGGDGTANEILNGINDKVSLAIIPAGTGNDFFRMISDDDSSIMKSIIACINGQNISVDYGQANEKKFLNSTTLGLDARVNNLVCTVLKKPYIPKKIIYSLAASISVLMPKPFEISLDIDGTIIKQKALLIGVMNGKYYGNGVRPINDVSIQDGMFDIIVIDKINVLKLLTLLPKYLKGKTEGIKEMKIYRGKKIVLTTDTIVDAQSDGENYKTNNVVFTIKQKALDLRVPMDTLLDNKKTSG